MSVIDLNRSGGNKPWIHRHFLSHDAKLRARERYWRTISSSTAAAVRDGDGESVSEGANCWIILDASSWRIYLPLIQRLLKASATARGGIVKVTSTMDQQASSSASDTRRAIVKWALLESVAELLDERSHAGEATGVGSERSAMIRLVEHHPGEITVLPDASVREGDERGRRGGGSSALGSEDEWGWMGYELMTTEERCRHSLVRAGRLLLSRSFHQQVSPLSGLSGGPRHDEVVLVASDPETLRFLGQVTLEEGIRVMSVAALAQFLRYDDDDDNISEIREGIGQSSSVKWQELVADCELEYDRRNRHRHRTTNPSTAGGGPADDEEATVSSLTCMTPEHIRDGLRLGRLHRGRVEVSRDNPREAFVATPGGTTYLVDVNRPRDGGVRAFHRDVVIVQELRKSEWARPSKRIVPYLEAAEDAEADDDDGELLDSSAPPIPTAVILSIEEPFRRVFVATLVDPPKDGGDSHVLLVPMDRRVPKIRVPSRAYYANQRLMIQVERWEIGSNYPSGRCIQVIGPIGHLETEVRALLIENQVRLEPFSAAALACLPPDLPEDGKWMVPDDEVDRRLDLRRSRLVFSVDPPGCQDIDDSMHAHVLPSGDVEVGVHIADVSYFVRHNSPLDLEAQARGTTFYLVDRRFDMLPPLLSSNLCSLHGQKDRLAVSVIWTMSPDLKRVKSTWFGRTVIHNCAGRCYCSIFDPLAESRGSLTALFLPRCFLQP